MKIAVRKEPNGLIYISKEFFNRFGEEHLNEYKFTLVEIKEEYADCVGTDFNEDLTFSVEKYNARKNQEKENLYEEIIVFKIRKKYSLNQELAILRQRDTKPDEFTEYNVYVEKCKLEAKMEVSNGN